ncbi:MAG: hypothetical protein ACRDOG_16020, partial [Gaiellaceae bacterium]
MQASALSFLRRRGVLIAAQLVFVAVVLASLGYALRDVWSDALPRLRDADVAVLFASLGVLAAYYFLFVVGWQWIL